MLFVMAELFTTSEPELLMPPPMPPLPPALAVTVTLLSVSAPVLRMPPPPEASDNPFVMARLETETVPVTTFRTRAEFVPEKIVPAPSPTMLTALVTTAPPV